MFSRTESNVSYNKTTLSRHESPAISLPPPASSRGHQRSRTTADLPPLFSRTPSASPTRSSTFLPFGRKSREASPGPEIVVNSAETNASGVESHRRIKPGTVGKITSWFEGASEPVNISFVPSPQKEISEPFYQLDNSEAAESNSTGMDNLTQRPRKQAGSGMSTANSSMFSFFKKTSTISAKNDPDVLIQMDIRDALLPGGPVDEVTPTAFKHLQLNAESLLRRFQASYVENLNALRQITSEKNIQNDELEAAQTRNEHLKFQLLDMAEKASEQEKIIASLKSQLVAPQSSVRMVTDYERTVSTGRSRRSRMSDISASDESFIDSDASSAISIFSDVDSITTPATSVAASPTMKHARLFSPTIIRGSSVQPQVTPVLVPQCQKCHNVPASEAWEVVDMMKMESTALKERITELEAAHDSALEFLTALKL